MICDESRGYLKIFVEVLDSLFLCFDAFQVFTLHFFGGGDRVINLALYDDEERACADSRVWAERLWKAEILSITYNC